jgi:hypothetical protein
MSGYFGSEIQQRLERRVDELAGWIAVTPGHVNSGRMVAQGVEMFVDRAWHAIPDFKIQFRTLEGDTGETGGSHWCRVEASDHPNLLMKFRTYCATERLQHQTFRTWIRHPGMPSANRHPTRTRDARLLFLPRVRTGAWHSRRGLLSDNRGLF